MSWIRHRHTVAVASILIMFYASNILRSHVYKEDVSKTSWLPMKPLSNLYAALPSFKLMVTQPLKQLSPYLPTKTDPLSLSKSKLYNFRSALRIFSASSIDLTPFDG